MEKTKLLIVDDEKSIIKSLSRTLAGTNLDILTAENGENGLKILEENKVDLIISDQIMPYMTGIEFLNQVQQKYPDIITMILTGYSDIDVAIKAINDVGVYKFILKPWDENDLRVTIEKAKKLSDLMQINGILKENIIDGSEKTMVACMIDKDK